MFFSNTAILSYDMDAVVLIYYGCDNSFESEYYYEY